MKEAELHSVFPCVCLSLLPSLSIPTLTSNTFCLFPFPLSLQVTQAGLELAELAYSACSCLGQQEYGI